jgi:hypothetical protein
MVNVEVALFTYIGVGITVFCLLVGFVMYLCCCSNIAALSRKALSHLLVMMIASIILFVIASFANLHGPRCQWVTYLLMYALLSMFCWILIVAEHLYRTIVCVLGNHGHPRLRMLLSACFAYVGPAVVVIITWSTLNTTRDDGVCWLSSDGVWAFVGPVVVVISIILFYFARMNQLIHNIRPSSALARRKSVKLVSRTFHAMLIVFLVLACAWLAALLSLSITNGAKYVFQCIFVISIGATSVFMLYFYTRDEKPITRSARDKRKTNPSITSYLRALEYNPDSVIQPGAERGKQKKRAPSSQPRISIRPSSVELDWENDEWEIASSTQPARPSTLQTSVENKPPQQRTQSSIRSARERFSAVQLDWEHEPSLDNFSMHSDRRSSELQSRFSQEHTRSFEGERQQEFEVMYDSLLDRDLSPSQIISATQVLDDEHWKKPHNHDTIHPLQSETGLASRDDILSNNVDDDNNDDRDNHDDDDDDTVGEDVNPRAQPTTQSPRLY